MSHKKKDVTKVCVDNKRKKKKEEPLAFPNHKTKKQNKNKRVCEEEKRERERKRERDDDGFLPFFLWGGEVSKKTKKSRNNNAVQ